MRIELMLKVPETFVLPLHYTLLRDGILIQFEVNFVFVAVTISNLFNYEP